MKLLILFILSAVLSAGAEVIQSNAVGFRMDIGTFEVISDTKEAFIALNYGDKTEIPAKISVRYELLPLAVSLEAYFLISEKNLKEMFPTISVNQTREIQISGKNAFFSSFSYLQGSMTVFVDAYYIRKTDRVYLITFAAGQDRFASMKSLFDLMIKTFDFAPVFLDSETDVITGNCFISGKYGFSISCPAGYEIKKDFQGFSAAFFGAVAADGIRSSVTVSREKLGKGFTLKQYFSKSVSNLELSIPECRVIDTAEVNINNSSACRLRIDFTVEKLRHSALVYLFVRNEYGYLITCSSSEKLFETEKAVFEKSALSFRFIDTRNSTEQLNGQFLDNEKGFALIYPLDWEAKEEYMNTDFSAFSQLEDAEDLFRENFNVLVRKIPDSMNNPDYYETVLESMKEILVDYKPIEKGTCEVSGISSDWQICSYDTGKFRVTALIYHIVFQGNVYILTFTADPLEFHRYLMLFRMIAGSFRILK